MGLKYRECGHCGKPTYAITCGHCGREESPRSPGCSTQTKDTIIELLEEVMEWHSRKDSADYNECDIDRCLWCCQAKQSIAELKR